MTRRICARIPKQQTTAMTVWLKYVAIGGGVSGLALSVSLGIVRRGDPAALIPMAVVNGAPRPTGIPRIIG